MINGKKGQMTRDYSVQTLGVVRIEQYESQS